MVSNIIFELNIPKKYQCFLNDMDSDSILSVLNAFKNHPSLKNYYYCGLYSSAISAEQPL